MSRIIERRRRREGHPRGGQDRAYTNPTDEQFERWVAAYGNTGVKSYTLSHGANAGALAYYREMTVAERMRLARYEQITEAAPEAFDIQRMIVATCLLYPQVDDYPFPPAAIMELFGRIRQHGHGALTQDEEHVGEEEDGQLPVHMVRDFRTAREAAQMLVTDPRLSTLYFNMAVRLASRGGSIDAQLLDFVVNLPPGRMRDLAALVELAHGTVLESSLKENAARKDLTRDQKLREEARLRAVYYSPFDVVDEVSGRQSMPFADAPAPEGEAEEAPAFYDEELLPDAPPSGPTAADYRRVLEG